MNVRSILVGVLVCVHCSTAMFEASPFDMDQLVSCYRRVYTVRVTQKDSQGRSCSGVVSVSSCWGRCPSSEITDWRFPFKRSYHPVCQHDDIHARQVRLNSCEPGTLPGTELYTVFDALSCQCQTCRADIFNCQELRRHQ